MPYPPNPPHKAYPPYPPYSPHNSLVISTMVRRKPSDAEL
jgi:hypothetical protein